MADKHYGVDPGVFKKTSMYDGKHRMVFRKVNGKYGRFSIEKVKGYHRRGKGKLDNSDFWPEGK